MQLELGTVYRFKANGHDEHVVVHKITPWYHRHLAWVWTSDGSRHAVPTECWERDFEEAPGYGGSEPRIA